MPKLRINKFESYVKPEHLATILEENGVSCERKRNGSIWAKSNSRSMHDLILFQNDFYNWFLDEYHSRSEINYAFFDHAIYFTADDGISVLVFCPYWAETNWPPLIPFLWKKGYRASFYKGTYAFTGVAVVRKKRKNDTLFEYEPSNEYF